MNLVDNLLSMTPTEIYDKAASGLNFNIDSIINSSKSSISSFVSSVGNTSIGDIMTTVKGNPTVPQTVIISNPVEVKNPATQTVEQKNSQYSTSTNYSQYIVPVLAGAVILFFVWRG